MPKMGKEKGKIKMEKLEVIYKDIKDIKPYENNPRDNSKAIEQVMKSIKEFGFKVPIVIDKDGTIVTGHTRYEACKQLGITSIPCVIANDLDEKQIKAFRLADNKVSDYSIWDNKKLLEELDDLGFDIFTGFEVSDLFEDIKELTELDEDDNDIIDSNEEGIVYTISFKTQNKQLLEKMKELIKNTEGSIYE